MNPEQDFLNHETGRGRPTLALSVPQLHLLRSFTSGRGTHRIEVGLRPIFVERCGASEEEWAALEAAGYLQTDGTHYQLTEAGRKAYRQGARGRYF